MSYNKGDKVNILASQGMVATIVDRESDFTWRVTLSDRCASWEGVVHEDEISPHVDTLFENIRRGLELLKKYDLDVTEDNGYGEGQIG